MGKKKTWKITTVCLGGIIVGLVAVALIINLINSNYDSIFDEYSGEDLAAQVEEAGDDAEKIITVYQVFIDNATGEEKAELLEDRVFAIQAVDPSGSYAEQVVDDLIVIDDILQTDYSAMQVSNAAYGYGFKDIGDRYLQIMHDRSPQVEENNMEVRG